MEATAISRVLLPSGRQLAYAQYGDPGGCPVFYFHGLPASRLEGGLLAAAAQATACRVIAPERPGFGCSDPHPGRRLHDWADDVAVLADALALKRYAVLGMSAGGPYALACAVCRPERLAGIGIVGGLGPCDQTGAVRALRLHGRMAMQLAVHAPGLLGPTYGLLTCAAMRYFPQPAYRLVAGFAPPADRLALSRTEVRACLIPSMIESMRQGPAPALQELGLFAVDWGMCLKSIVRPVHLWHGTADQVVPLSHAEYYARVLPQSRLTTLPNEGHFSLPINHAESILRVLRQVSS